MWSLIHAHISGPWFITGVYKNNDAWANCSRSNERVCLCFFSELRSKGGNTHQSNPHKYIHSLQWHHNGHDSVSNHQPHDCLLNRLFRRRSKKTTNSASLAFVRGIHRGPVNSPHKWPVTRKMFPFHDVIMIIFLGRHDEPINDEQKDDFSLHSVDDVTFDWATAVMTSKLIVQYKMLLGNCDTST